MRGWHAAASPQVRGLTANKHYVPVEERLDAIAHPTQPLSPLDPGQLEVPMAVQTATEGGEFKVQAAQRALAVVYWLAGNPHDASSVVGGTGISRVTKV
jgi:hypothetical protein